MAIEIAAKQTKSACADWVIRGVVNPDLVSFIFKYDLEKEYKNNKHFQALYSQAAQQALRTVSESFKSFDGLIKAFRKG
ncbi:MAG: hypothetical protein RID09_27245, partial [Coleofasciculus sp. G1-WW12-02]